MIDLEARLRRLEAVESVRSVFVQYVQYMDAGLVDELITLFDPNAHFLAHNEPPGTGGTVEHHGTEAIETHYRPLPFGYFRHHPSNTAIDVAPDASAAELSSYFLTTFPGGVQGGLYECSFVSGSDEQWRIARMQITSSWCWVASETSYQYFEPLSKHALREGAPVVWDRTIATDSERAN